jgi:hypothetical protein
MHSRFNCLTIGKKGKIISFILEKQKDLLAAEEKLNKKTTRNIVASRKSMLF